VKIKDELILIYFDNGNHIKKSIEAFLIISLISFFV
jgi:hypothetical protein